MKQRLPLFLGVFAVMALSNAIVPVLPSFAEEAPAIQGAIFSAYFLGAFFTVLPAGLLSDRIGKIPLIRLGLLFTFISGGLIILFPTAIPVFLARSLEGIGAGFFIAAALSWVNSQKDHSSLSGYFFAALNLGLVIGLLGTGWLEQNMGITGGVILFTIISGASLLLSIFIREPVLKKARQAHVSQILRSYIWLFISAIVLVGVTGVVTAIYPEFTGESPAILSVQIGMMNVATIVTTLLAPRFDLDPVQTIRTAAILMSIAVIGCFFTPAFGSIAIMGGFALIGGVAGFVIIAQMKFLAETRVEQGAMIGLFNTSTYLGLTLLPFVAGVIAQIANFFSAFLIISILTASMALTIGRCRCESAV